MTGEKIRIAIFGGSGYGGSELLRILLFHPNAEIVFITANDNAGKTVGEVHRNLFGLCDLKFITQPGVPGGIKDIDVVFFALPHGRAMNLIPQLPERVKAIDLSGDFRISDPEMFEKFYNLEHTSMETQRKFVYGLTETNREKIKAARFIANPGCFATATILALAPLVASGGFCGKIVVDAKTGSSGSGAMHAPNTHHPERMNSFYAYKPFIHQHLPEISEHLSVGKRGVDEFVFMTHSLPVARGIFASCYTEARDNITSSELTDLYRNFYKDSCFVRIVENSPNINWVKMTNFCDISIHKSGKNIAVFSAIDNLIKGAAGQAVQNMNLMFGLDEKTGLVMGGSNP